MTSEIKALISGLGNMAQQNASVAQLLEIGRPTIEPLLEALDTEDQVAQAGIVTVLRRIGPDAVPPLIRALESPSQIVQGNAINTLTMIGREAAGPLVEALAGSNTQIRANARQVVRQLGPAVVPALEDAAQGAGGSVNAKVLLIELDASKFGAFEDDLVAALGSPDQAVVAGAIDAIARCGERALSLMRALMGDSDTLKQQNSTNAMIRLSPSSIPILIKALADEHSQIVQQNAVRALVAIGPAAEAEVQRASKAKDELLRQNAQAVLDGLS